MAIPDYETLMLPLLKIPSDCKEHEANEVTELLSNEFKLTVDERRELLPSGQKPVIYSRVHWAKTYLKAAGLLDSTARGRYRITQRGSDILKEKPDRIDGKFLSRFSEFIDFKRRSRKDESKNEVQEDQSKTPEELLESGYQNVRDTLVEELLEKIRKTPPKIL